MLSFVPTKIVFEQFGMVFCLLDYVCKGAFSCEQGRHCS